MGNLTVPRTEAGEGQLQHPPHMWKSAWYLQMAPGMPGDRAKGMEAGKASKQRPGWKKDTG